MKKLALLLALVMALSVMGGMTVMADDAPEAPLELEFVDRTGYEWDTTPLFEEIEKKFNVKLNSVAYPVGEEGSTWYALAILSGNMPAYIADLTPDELVTYTRQGLFKELSVEMVEELAPEMCTWWRNEYVENVFDFGMVDGGMYAIPVLWSLSNTWNTLAIREDLCVQLGVELPQTLDELDAVMAQAKEVLGLDYLFTGSGIGTLQFLLGSYDVYRGVWYEGEDGELYWWTYHPNAKMAVQHLADWYQKGYIDPEFLTNDSAMVTDRVTSGKTFLVPGIFPDFCTTDGWSGGGAIKYPLEERVEGAKLANLGAIESDYGKGGYGSNPYTGWFGFSYELTDEQVAKYLEIFNWYSQTFEALELGQKGIEGVHFTKDDKGNYSWTEEFRSQESRDAIGVGIGFPGNFNNYAIQYPFFTNVDGIENRQYWEDQGFYKPNMLGAVPRELWSEWGASFKDYCDKNLIDFVTGQRNIDEWDAFIDELNTQYKGAELVQEANDTLALYTSLTDKFAAE